MNIKIVLKRIVSLALVIFTIIISGSNTDDKTKNSPTDLFDGHENDAALIAEIYPVSKDNPFIIADFDELVFHLKYGTGIVIFAFPDCPRCKNVFPVLEKAFNDMDMGRHAGFRGKILYYDFYNDREENNERYQTLVDFTKEYLPLDENGNPRIYSPDVYFLAAGKIVGNHLDTVESLIDPHDLLNDEQKAELSEIYKELINNVEDCGC